VSARGVRQLVAFLVGGVIGFIVDASVLMACIRLLEWPPLASRVPSFLIAATVTWRYHRRFTFPVAASSRGGVREWLRFLAANAVGNAVNLGTYALLLHPFGRSPLAALAIASVAAAALNFAVSKWWVFRGSR
jgi:putative flippase GtrA